MAGWNSGHTLLCEGWSSVRRPVPGQTPSLCLLGQAGLSHFWSASTWVVVFNPKACFRSSPPSPAQDEKITVNQDVPVHEGKPHIVHFQYKVTEVKTSSWDAVLSNQSLFVEIPDGLLADGSKEG